MSDKKKIRLLVVDDECRDDENGYFTQLQEIVDLSGHIYDITCRFVASGEEGLQLIKSWEPSVIMVDAHLDDINGVEIIKKGNIDDVPVIVTSNFRSTDIEESSKQQGASAYFPKIDNPDEFEGLLHKIAFISADISPKH